MKAWMVYTEGAKAILEDGLEYVRVHVYADIKDAYEYAIRLERRGYVAYVKEVNL